MIHFKSDRSLTPIPAEEVSELRLGGPLKSMTGRSVVHLTRSEALAFARWLGFPLDRPELETIEGPESDATARDLAPAVRVRALQSGTAAGTKPPGAKPRGTRKGPRAAS